MNTIAGIERYAAAEGDVGMFITLTAPSKYHPTRQVRKGEKQTVQRLMAGTMRHLIQRMRSVISAVSGA